MKIGGKIIHKYNTFSHGESIRMINIIFVVAISTDVSLVYMLLKIT